MERFFVKLEDRHCESPDCRGVCSAMYLASEVDARIQELKKALRDLVRGYVNTMEVGRDRIVSLGGDCDPVDIMERGDPHLNAAKKVLGLMDK